MNKPSLYILALSTLFLSACNEKSLNVKKVSSEDTTDKPVRSGFPYSLAFTQFEIDITRGIANCTTDIDNLTSSTHKKALPDVKAFIKADISLTNVADGDNTYIIDASSMMGFAKKTELELTWKDGKLLTINASSDDQTAEIISSVSSGVAELALSNIGVFNNIKDLNKDLNNENITSPPVQKVIQCTSSTLKAITNIKDLTEKINTATKQVANLQKEISELKQTISALNISGPMKDCPNEADSRCKLKQLIGNLNEQNNLLAATQESIKESKAKISYTQKYFWPPRSNIPKTDTPYKVAKNKLNTWVEDSEIDTITGISEVQKSKAAFAKEFDVFFQLKKIGSYGVSDIKKYKDEQKDNAGLRYRIPASGYLVACKSKLCDKTDTNEVIAVKEGKIAQLGHIFYIPVVSKTFGNVSLSMSFSENGELNAASMKQTESPGENIAKVFEGVVSDVTTYKSAYADKNKPKTELESLTEQLNLLEAQEKLITAQNKLTPDNATLLLNNIQIETQLAEAQKKYIDSLQALDTIPEAQQNNAAASAIINSETLLLKAEAARLQAMLAIKNAQASLEE